MADHEEMGLRHQAADTSRDLITGIVYHIRRLMQVRAVYTKEVYRKHLVSVPQLLCVLTLYEHGPLPPSQIAGMIMVNSSTMTRIKSQGLTLEKTSFIWLRLMYLSMYMKIRSPIIPRIIFLRCFIRKKIIYPSYKLFPHHEEQCDKGKVHHCLSTLRETYGIDRVHSRCWCFCLCNHMQCKLYLWDILS